jgi:hypothetical protein
MNNAAADITFSSLPTWYPACERVRAADADA